MIYFIITLLYEVTLLFWKIKFFVDSWGCVLFQSACVASFLANLIFSESVFCFSCSVHFKYTYVLMASSKFYYVVIFTLIVIKEKSIFILFLFIKIIYNEKYTYLFIFITSLYKFMCKG